MIAWTVHHRVTTESTNLDARCGRPGDVFTADAQTAGRGRLDHRWLSAPGENLTMSCVLSVAGLAPAEAASLPLAVGLAVVRAVDALAGAAVARLKWPNDVFVGGRKVAGILCERHDDNVIAGIGLNVRQRTFPSEIASRATSLANEGVGRGGDVPTVAAVRDAVLGELAAVYEAWRTRGFAAIHPEIVQCDFLRGRRVRVMRFDGDDAPIAGVVDGILADGSLSIAGERVYAGEVHVSFPQ